ncbi:uncharacterized protein LOC108341316 [Vigna angularis]|uniref:uncharacterized protein LOC108341316 n=1 Tax=Phaseolus angularis TaxID=3914 RepID=UPI000809AC13|nr:uncharacterized protein LOC108341316 [Vigna angularis]
MEQQDAGQPICSEDARRVARYVMVGDDLYRRGFSTPLLKYLFGPESHYVLNELHNGICGLSTGQRTLKAGVVRVGHYWPTMEQDAKQFVQKMQGVPSDANDVHASPSVLHNMVSPWPFAYWRMDIIGTLC